VRRILVHVATASLECMATETQVPPEM